MALRTLVLLFFLTFFYLGSNTVFAVDKAAPQYVVEPYQSYSYEMMLEDAEALQDAYPELVSLKTIGKSVEGRDLLLIEFGKGERNIFLNGATHAREYITTSYLMYMIDRYAYAYENGGLFEGYDLETIFSGVTFCIVPMVNPDGVNLVQNGISSVENYSAVSKIAINKADRYGYTSWKANINGVDLNRNYPDHWNVKTAVTKPSSSNYKGAYPLSEPESKALVDFLNNEMCWAYLTFHAQGEAFYGWDDPNSIYYPQLSSMVSRLTQMSGYKKLVGTADTSYGNFANYVRGIYLKPTLTIELCNYVGPYPFPNKDFDGVWKPAKTISLIMAEEVLKMEDQKYLVYQNENFLHGFSDEKYALRYAKKWENGKVVFLLEENPDLKTINEENSIF